MVSTFCHQLSIGETPEVQIDRELPLLHAQRAARILLDAPNSCAESRQVTPTGNLRSVRGLLEALRSMRDHYRTADLPDLSDPFTRDLFNTYRSYTFPDTWPIYSDVRADERGELFESVKSPGGEAQVFFSTTRPGYTRGQHFHLNKVERFLVRRGTGVEATPRRPADDKATTEPLLTHHLRHGVGNEVHVRFSESWVDQERQCVVRHAGGIRQSVLRSKACGFERTLEIDLRTGSAEDGKCEPLSDLGDDGVPSQTRPVRAHIEVGVEAVESVFEARRR